MLPQRADDPGADIEPPARSTDRAEFEQDLRALLFPTTLRELLPRSVRLGWMALLWLVIAALVVGLLLVRMRYVGLTSVKW